MGYKVNPPSTEELRELAVQRLSVARTRNDTALGAEQAHKLLEEVAIGKIEVEIQNRYLQETCARLDAALNEITDIYEFAPVGCFSTDAAGKIIRLNLSGARLLRVERNALLGLVFVDFFPQLQRKRIQRLMHQASVSAQDQYCEVPLQDANGVTRQVQLSLSSRVGGQGYNMVLSNAADFHGAKEELADELRARDVGLEKKSLEDELLELRSIQQAVFESLPQYLAVLDAQGMVLRTNALWNAYGMASGRAYRNGLSNVAYADLMDAVSADGEDRLAALAGITEVLGGKVPSFQLEYSFWSGEKQRWFVMQVMAVRHPRARAVVSHQDVTHIKG